MASLGDVQNTFSSWDTCMNQAYCKWPVIVGIIIGSLVVLSILFCIIRCLCFGAECCACCCSCFTCCYPSRSRRGGRDYQPPPQLPYQQYPQYSSPPPPMYGQPSPYRGPQTANFDARTKPGRYNEDALPAMPSWDNATTRHVEEEPLEMSRMSKVNPQEQHLLAGQEQYQYGDQRQPQDSGNYQQGQFVNSYQANGARQPASPGYAQAYQQGHTQAGSHTPSFSDYAPSTQYAGYDGDMGNRNVTRYHAYDNHQQYAPSLSPVSTTAYGPSTTVPPSYHTREPSIVSPIQSTYSPLANRRPVNGSWRDV